MHAPWARVGAGSSTIVLLLSYGIAGTVVEDRGLDFSLVWFPLELLVLTKARQNPRWLLWLPPLCLVWVNTHGSVLIGLLVLGIELVWSLAPGRLVGADRRDFAVDAQPAPSGWRCSAACSHRASRPTGPGCWATTSTSRAMVRSRKYINEWNSPDFHSLMALVVYLVPVALSGRVHPLPPSSRCWRARWAPSSSWRPCARSASSST